MAQRRDRFLNQRMEGSKHKLLNKCSEYSLKLAYEISPEAMKSLNPKKQGSYEEAYGGKKIPTTHCLHVNVFIVLFTVHKKSCVACRQLVGHKGRERSKHKFYRRQTCAPMG